MTAPTAAEVIRRCRLLAEHTEQPGHITRTFLSPPMRSVIRLVSGWMTEAGLEPRVDAAGNLRGVRGPSPRLMIGSHLDTVPQAGAFDGILGVMIGIALAARTSTPLEIAAFSEEEGVRFAIPFIGSRALVADPVADPRVLAAIRDFGLDPAALPEAAIGHQVHSYLEFHIEQGPVLDRLDLPLGVVDSIAGSSRFEMKFTGRAGHAGTTPMSLRHDALAGAAEWILAVEAHALARAGLVATVGAIRSEPGAVNVIPGLVRTSLDVRHSQDQVRLDSVHHMTECAQSIAARRGLSVAIDTLLDQPAVALHPEPVERAVRTAGFPVHILSSGAGHDAMILARKVPASMLFLRSPGGISHHPSETVLEEDVEAALSAGEAFLQQWRPA